MKRDTGAPRRIAIIFALCSTAMFATALTAAPSEAATPSFKDLLGRWCGASSNYLFTRAQLTVSFPDGTRRVLRIAKAITAGGTINVMWSSGGNTIFGEFSANRRQMFQQANTSGDMGPRLEFRRC